MKIHTNKLNHMRGVAEYMYQNAEKYGLDPEQAYTVGLLHDIGYINESAAKRDFDFFDDKYGHEVYGALLLEKMGFKNRDIHFAIMFHGTSPFELLDITRKNPWLQLLWEADMSIDKYGNRVGFDKRLSDIGHRYGFESDAYRTACDTVAYLQMLEQQRETKITFYGYDKDNDLLEEILTTNLNKAPETGKDLLKKVEDERLSSSKGEPYDWVEVSINGSEPVYYFNSEEFFNVHTHLSIDPVEDLSIASVEEENDEIDR